MIMDINERSKEYAAGKALSAINAAIEQAYIDGYNDGLKHLENERLEALKEGVEYVDLGLPSGTLWSSTFVKYDTPNGKLPYLEASKMNIPTKDQFIELCNVCNYGYIYNSVRAIGVKFTGPTGKTITIKFTNVDGLAPVDYKKKFHFWLRDDEETNKRYNAESNGDKKELAFEINKIFMGLKLPIMLVK